ncbi:unnamed protein product [Calypogeia fissa]
MHLGPCMSLTCTHPHGTDLLYVVEGILDVGFIDTTNKLFTKTLQAGDLFVFPEGLVHYQINYGKDYTVKAVAMFSSSNPGLVRLPDTLFKSGILRKVLEKAFGVGAHTIDHLQDATVN